MFCLHFHYEDVSHQDPLLKPNNANIMEVLESCEIRLIPKGASGFRIKFEKLAMEIPHGQRFMKNTYAEGQTFCMLEKSQLILQQHRLKAKEESSPKDTDLSRNLECRVQKRPPRELIQRGEIVFHCFRHHQSPRRQECNRKSTTRDPHWLESVVIIQDSSVFCFSRSMRYLNAQAPTISKCYFTELMYLRWDCNYIKLSWVRN